MSLKRSLISAGGMALAVLGFGLSLSAASAQGAQPSLLGTFDDWEAYKTTDARGAVCYAISAPKTKLPAAAKRDAVYFLLTSWPGAKISNEPSLLIGYPFKEESKASVQVGTEKFDFFTKADGGWLPTGPEEAKLVAAMRSTAEMTVKGTSKRGTLTTDTYSLKGLSAALDKVAEGCK